ncbi:MAG: hypothetical protein H5T68_12210 [Chloroflexi bacterium]|nr:hypothetical protein [Chloroflexota bacterium]HCD09855.1 hypothetical protein [Thermoanaerobacter sp.]
MSRLINIFPIVPHERKIKNLKIVDISENISNNEGFLYTDTYSKKKYLYPSGEDELTIEESPKFFSKLIVQGFLNRASSNSFKVFSGRVLNSVLDTSDPIYEDEFIRVYKGLTIQPIFWKSEESLNFGLIVDLRTRNEFKETILSKRSDLSQLPSASYTNIYKYYPEKASLIIDKIKIYTGERLSGISFQKRKIREDALKVKFDRMVELLKKILHFNPDMEKGKFRLPTQQEVSLLLKPCEILMVEEIT